MTRLLAITGWGALGLVLLLTLLTVAFRHRWTPALTAIRRMNRAVVNPRQLRTAGRPGAPAAVVRHTGRRSGAAYRTPVVAVEADGGFLFALPYGPGADWVRNVLAAGAATVEHEGATVPVDRPRLVAADDADPHFGAGERRMHRLFGVRDFLQVRRAAARPVTPQGGSR